MRGMSSRAPPTSGGRLPPLPLSPLPLSPPPLPCPAFQPAPAPAPALCQGLPHSLPPSAPCLRLTASPILPPPSPTLPHCSYYGGNLTAQILTAASPIEQLTLGNHEFDLGAGGLRAFLAQLHLPQPPSPNPPLGNHELDLGGGGASGAPSISTTSRLQPVGARSLCMRTCLRVCLRLCLPLQLRARTHPSHRQAPCA
jgi:hypothetical protein